MDSIRIAEELNGLEKIHVSKLREFQGNLKDLSKSRYAKLKRSIEKHGIFIPVFVWKDKLLDGHQRLRVALTEGWDIEWPIIRISADSEEDAREKLLAISSQYGKVTQEGWDEFTAGLNESWLLESTHFDALPFVFDSDWLEGNKDDPSAGAGAGTEPALNPAIDELDEDEVRLLQQMAGYQTAIARSEKSAPVKFYEGRGFLSGSVLDYGCGMEVHDYGRFDPHHDPDYSVFSNRYDVVMCNYVLNVIPLIHGRVQTIQTLLSMLNAGGYALVAVWKKDGVAEEASTGKGYQCGWGADRWEELFGSIGIEAERLTAPFFCWKLLPAKESA